ncbi:MAG: nicotinate-nucleotide--dimethylbenzimidazole phosphoribosyltransferase [Lachnospiraceae bacterium]|nr:nicotinate-nucleotide--dimethylbenzimidazole phosphoribosyltransferase [Lachnospiraceae bacterium]
MTTNDLTQLLTTITPASQKAYDACIYHLDHIAKPIGSLGKLESLLADIAGASGTPLINIEKKCVLVFCADNGVLAQGVAQSTHEVTTAITQSLVRHTTSVCAMAKAADADVFPIDMGMIDTVEGLLPCSVAKGTCDISQGAAMTRQQAVGAICTGIELVRQKKEEGYRLIATGEAGIGNTTTSSAVLSVLLNQPVELVTGRGSGLSDEGLKRKQNAIRQAIAVNQPDPSDPLDVLSKLGGFDIAAMCGAFIGGALCHIPVIMDGFISGVAALCAIRLNPLIRGYILPSHITAEPAGQMLMKEMGFAPMIHGDMRLGEGTGAVALMPLLDLAVSVYYNAASFDDIHVEKYEKWK